MNRAQSSRPGLFGGLVSLLGLVLLLVGVPAALILVSPIAHFHLSMADLRHLSALLNGIRHPISDTTFVAGSLVLAWVVWSYFLLCVVVEIVGRARGRIPARLFLGARLQTAVAAVVGASLSIMPVVRATAPMRLQPLGLSTAHSLQTSLPGDATAGMATARFETNLVEHPPATIDSPRAATTADELARSITATYTVRPGDTLWSIAERELGAPLRWKEIAALNMGRPQADGASLQDDHWILPGWVLVLPSTATIAPARPSPHLTEAVASASPVSVPSASKQAAPAQHQARLPVAPIGAGILGAGFVVTLNRMRRAQQRRRRTGRVIKLPEGHLADVERGLRVTSSLESLTSVDRALRMLGSLTGSTAGPGSPLVAVRTEPDGVELLFDRSRLLGPAPAPFEATEDPAVWALPARWQETRGTDELRALEGTENPCPTLVTIGYEGPATALVNLESLGSLSIAGADAALLLEAVIVELGTLPWAESVDVVVVGHTGELKALERVRQLTTVAAAVAEVRRRLAAEVRLAGESGLDSTADARWKTSDSAWDAMVVVCLPSAAEAEQEACRRLIELAGDGHHGICALIGSSMTARWTAVVDDGGPMALMGPAGWLPHPGVVRQPSAPDLLDDVDSILAIASGDEDDPRPGAVGIAEPATRAGISLPPSSRTAAGRSDEHEIEVRVLGPVEVVGGKPFTRAWALELVVYLVMHESGASTDQWSTALWPDRLMAPASLHSTASSARRSLGTSIKGEDHLPRSHGRLALAKTVTSDWAQFRHLAASDDPEQLAQALRLIRGRPFLGLRSTDWVLLEGFMADIEGTVVDAACRLAEHALQQGDPTGAETAARCGLKVSEFDERLYRLLLRAADAAGNPAGVESTMRELVRLVADEVEPYDAVHPDTLELYKQLSRRAGMRRGA